MIAGKQGRSPLNAVPIPARSNGEAAGARTPGSSSLASLLSALSQLELLLDQETQLLRSKVALDLSKLCERKTQALMELGHIKQTSSFKRSDTAVKQAVERLQAKMALNSSALRMHYEACREISAVLAEAIREADSDGTYCWSIAGARRRK